MCDLILLTAALYCPILSEESAPKNCFRQQDQYYYKILRKIAGDIYSSDDYIFNFKRRSVGADLPAVRLLCCPVSSYFCFVSKPILIGFLKAESL